MESALYNAVNPVYKSGCDFSFRTNCVW